MANNKTVHTSDPAERYATHLQFLWEQYNKLMGLGVLASAATLAFLLQGVLFNKDAREVITGLKVPLNTAWLIAAIVFAGVAAISFITSRWCSQILMERQVDGDYKAAVKYFEETLGDETVWPTALQPKRYMGWVDRKRLLKFIGSANEFAKWLGILLILASWIASFAFAWPLIEPLATVAVKK